MYLIENLFAFITILRELGKNSWGGGFAYTYML